MTDPKPKLDPEDPPAGFCSGCGEPCGGQYEDEGCLPGQHCWHLVSDCCSEPILDDDPRPEVCEVCNRPERLPART